MHSDTVFLPEIIIDTHCHGRDMHQIHKTTIRQTLKESVKGKIAINFFMPNTDPPIIDIDTLEIYSGIIESAQEAVESSKKQYLYFGATDDNLSACKKALKRREIVGIKIYPKSKSGHVVTTGTIGVSEDITILRLLNLSEISGKPIAFHCDDPEIIALEGNTIRAEAAYVEKILTMACDFPRAKIVICHVSCRQSAELVIAAQKKGQWVALELCPQYLWFDADGTNWNPILDPIFYHCYNNLRPKIHREFLSGLLLDEELFMIIGSDNAPHTREEKLKKKWGGLPSNQEMVAAMLTLAWQMKIPNRQIIRLLCLNASKFFCIPVASQLKQYRLEKRIVDSAYNNGIIENPWKGSELYFPVPAGK